MTPKLTTAQTITLIAAALSLTCACGIGYRNTPPPSPPPITALSVHPASLTFPATPLLTESQPLQIVVTNDYDQPVHFALDQSLADRKNFRADTKLCHILLDPQQSCTIAVIYTPGTPGPTHGRLHIRMTNGSSIPVELEGTTVPAPPTNTP